MAAPERHDLADIAILADLTADQRRDFEKSCRWRRFEEGEFVIDQESETRDVYFLVRGRVRVVNFTSSGKEVALEDLTAGTYFGELAAIDGRPRSTSVVTLADSDIAKIAPERFLKLLAQYPVIAHKVMVNLTHVIRTATERIVDLSTLGANNRVHGELLRQARAGEVKGNSAVIRPIPVHSDMASRASTTRETVARVMNDLARRGIVKREKDCLVIRDIDGLEGLVEDVRG